MLLTNRNRARHKGIGCRCCTDIPTGRTRRKARGRLARTIRAREKRAWRADA